MSVFYKLDKREIKGLNQEAKTIVFARAYHPSVTTMDQMGTMIAHISAVSVGDVKSVLNTLSLLISRELQAGRIVDLGDLGRLRVGIRSKATKSEDEFSPRNIRSAHTIYTPGAEIRRAMRGINYRAYLSSIMDSDKVPNVKPNQGSEDTKPLPKEGDENNESGL